MCVCVSLCVCVVFVIEKFIMKPVTSINVFNHQRLTNDYLIFKLRSCEMGI